MCGENSITSSMSAQTVGSPPRVRGKLIYYTYKNMPERITPACAGKTALKQVAKIMLKDHPRVCGENRESYYKNAISRGSPPRVRGKPWNFSNLEMRPRITPACAGKTFC